MGPIILNDVYQSFDDTKVLESFQAKFLHGHKYYITGASGQGKTTLLRILMGLLSPDFGEIKGLKDYKVSAVFQEDRLITQLNAIHNISLTCNKNNTVIMQYLYRFGLEGFEFIPVSSLSGGMKRRVAILRALLSEFDLLLLDEPFKGLDSDIKQVVIKEIIALSHNKTVILVTHSPEEAIALGITNQITI